MPKMSEDPQFFPINPPTNKSYYGKKIVIICPVRNVSPEVVEFIRLYVENLEKLGAKVYWPYRDNPYQNTDKIGLQIIEYNRSLMITADEIHIYYDPSSEGSILDLGMLYMALELYGDKGIFVINPSSVQTTPEKSLANVITELAKQFGDDKDEE